MKILLVCAGAGIAYKVLRCAALNSRGVYVLGDARAVELRSSRYCARYLPSGAPIDRDHVEAIAEAINAATAAHRLAFVIPGDTESTRVLTLARHLIHAPLFPLPSAEVFESLANKWTFKSLCDELAIPTPASRLLADKPALADALVADTGREWIAKPVDREGGCGVVELNGRAHPRPLELIDYEPILMQEFVPGLDLSLSLFCREGEPLSVASYTHHGNALLFRQHAELERHALRIAAHYKFTGIICFDARLTRAGEVLLLECNPRFWNNVDAAMLCGLNFVELGLRNEPVAEFLRLAEGTRFRNPLGVRQAIASFGSIGFLDLKVLLHWLKDYSFSLRRRAGKG